MKKRNWRVTILQEFYPNDQRLLGLNIDRGKKICIRLRPHYDQTRFFDFNDLIGTMLHELSHIECAPHDAKFYKLLDLLHDEYDELLVKGHTGDWFFGNHYRLGQSNNVPLASAGLKSLETIEKKQQLERIMPKGGIRLGGTAHTNYNLPIRELTAMAIEQRLKDIVWCGVRIPADKLPKVTTTKTNSETEKWSCPQCTFVNRPLVLQCEICLEERPNYGENILESDRCDYLRN
ncbi:4016_t:CDS:2 [Entrophospora sp. SA101]|nr:2069_t:CDS:2 [Entrophospora sp. SA101]CAJ0757035.1 4016_t:CDS:2 [Entrophospora sp. SA101]CAJ0845129.1 6274_t:CDS:2 [Entrophospora sp. SA101]CAJ0883805.1 12236_t:CDS:2 [Entrophospora sp. SA101]